MSGFLSVYEASMRKARCSCTKAYEAYITYASEMFWPGHGSLICVVIGWSIVFSAWASFRVDWWFDVATDIGMNDVA